jgi:hypothetical protein
MAISNKTVGKCQECAEKDRRLARIVNAISGAGWFAGSCFLFYLIWRVEVAPSQNDLDNRWWFLGIFVPVGVFFGFYSLFLFFKAWMNPRRPWKAQISDESCFQRILRPYFQSEFQAGRIAAFVNGYRIPLKEDGFLYNVIFVAHNKWTDVQRAKYAILPAEDWDRQVGNSRS